MILRVHPHGVQQGKLCNTAPLGRATNAMILHRQMHEGASQDREGYVVRGVRFRECLM